MPTVSKKDIPDLVKNAILRTAGHRHPDPATVDDEAAMADFNFSFFNYSDLTVRLDQIVAVFKPHAFIEEKDIEDCEAVKDCIQLVQDTINA